MLSNDYSKLKEINPHITVEAEYGDAVVEGSLFTLAHHVGKWRDNISPCMEKNGVAGCLPDDVVIGISHWDWDTVGGIFACVERKPISDLLVAYDTVMLEWSDVWGAIGWCDIHGPHKANEYTPWAWVEPIVNAMWAFSEKHRVFADRSGEPRDVTAELEVCSSFLCKLTIEIKSSACRWAIWDDSDVVWGDFDDTPLLKDGAKWMCNKESLDNDSLITRVGSNVLRSSSEFTNHLYPDGGGVVLSYNSERKTIALSCSDWQVDCCKFMQGEFGLKAGGHPGIAGTPRGQEYTIDDAKDLFHKVCHII